MESVVACRAGAEVTNYCFIMAVVMYVCLIDYTKHVLCMARTRVEESEVHVS